MRLLPQTFTSVLVTASLVLGAGTASANTIDVKIQNFQFIGKDITISVGDTVRWTNLDSTTHTSTQGRVHMPDGSEFWNHTFPP